MEPYVRLRAVMGRRPPPPRRPASAPSPWCYRYQSQHRYHPRRRTMTAYGFGQQWTGALSRGPAGLFDDDATELSPEEIERFGEPQAMVPLDGAGEGRRCVAASAGWGHTALLAADGVVGAAGNGGDPRLMVCGRPHDFQTLMRLRRLPPFLRNFCVRYTLPGEEEEEVDPPPSVLQKIASYLAGDNDITFHEEECRRYSNVPTLLEVDLPGGDVPALEGDRIDDSAFEIHAAGRVAKDNGESQRSPLHTRFQNTLVANAGVTAVISKTGALYTFGLNHRGQCGTGSFTPNIWTPSRVAGLASTRFILDHGTGSGDDLFKKFREQEHPIVSVALGLQHGVALDSAGQAFCWGKGERGQLGQGRRMAHEDRKEEGLNEEVVNEEEPNQNRTFEYAIQVESFHDPYATTTPSPGEIYAPILSQEDSKVRMVSAGMNFTMAVTESNLPYVWGKNVCLNPDYSALGANLRSKPTRDSTYPRYVPGLPPGLPVQRVACGTHHAAMLLEDGSIWAVGVATDRPAPLWGEAVEVLAPGLVEVKELVSFTAGFGRTAVVFGADNGRRQAIEIQLWSNEEFRQNGAVRPSWLDWLENQEGKQKVRSVHRGWMHSVVVTEDA